LLEIAVYTESDIGKKVEDLLKKGFEKLAGENFVVKTGDRIDGELLLVVFFSLIGMELEEVKSVIGEAFAEENFENSNFSEANAMYFAFTMVPTELFSSCSFKQAN